MADKTGIEWTDATWNPVRGCSRVSEGCRHCYAERVAARFSGPGLAYESLARMSPNGPRWTGEVRLVEGTLNQPLHWRKPRRIFVNSMSDLFHERLSDEDIRRVFDVMLAAPHHTYQILTKRPQRMAEFMERWLDDACWPQSGCPIDQPPRHIWLGVSVENQAAANERIPWLLRTPAAIRFLSCEPLLGPLVIDHWLCDLPEDEDGAPYPGRLHWVITGGESGQGARRLHPDWVREVRDQCQQAGVAYFHKQNGEWIAGQIRGRFYKNAMGPTGPILSYSERYSDGYFTWWRVGKKIAGRLIDGREWSEFPPDQPLAEVAP